MTETNEKDNWTPLPDCAFIQGPRCACGSWVEAVSPVSTRVRCERTKTILAQPEPVAKTHGQLAAEASWEGAKRAAARNATEATDSDAGLKRGRRPNHVRKIKDERDELRLALNAIHHIAAFERGTATADALRARLATIEDICNGQVRG